MEKDEVNEVIISSWSGKQLLAQTEGILSCTSHKLYDLYYYMVYSLFVMMFCLVMSCGLS